MPKFLYTIIVFATISWWGIARIITQNRPEQTSLIIGVLILLFIALTLTLSIPGYFVFRRKAPDFTNLRVLYRKSLRWSWIGGFIITGFMTLRAFSLDSALNLTLFLILCVMIVLHFWSKRT